MIGKIAYIKLSLIILYICMYFSTLIGECQVKVEVEVEAEEGEGVGVGRRETVYR